MLRFRVIVYVLPLAIVGALLWQSTRDRNPERSHQEPRRVTELSSSKSDERGFWSVDRKRIREQKIEREWISLRRHLAQMEDVEFHLPESNGGLTEEEIQELEAELELRIPADYRFFLLTQGGNLELIDFPFFELAYLLSLDEIEEARKRELGGKSYSPAELKTFEIRPRMMMQHPRLLRVAGYDRGFGLDLITGEVWAYWGGDLSIDGLVASSWLDFLRRLNFELEQGAGLQDTYGERTFALPRMETQ